MQKFDTKTFRGLILTLQDYWARQGCTIVQPLDMEVGAGTSHPMTSLRALGPEPMATAYVQPSRRPTDGRYGETRTVCSTTISSVVIKPSPDNIQELYLGSLKELGMDQPFTTFVSWKITGKTQRWVQGSGLGSVAERHGSDPVHLLPAGWWSGM